MSEKYMTPYEGCSFENVVPRSGGLYSLYCTNCCAWVPDTANYEMKREGYYAYSHSCVKRPDGRIEWYGDFMLENDAKEEGVKHEKGLQILLPHM